MTAAVASASSPAVATPLTWALVICTYQRREMLMRCLKAAMGQTRRPDEVVVVDASPDWDVSRDEAVSRFGEAGLQYVKALRPSLPVQRNQGVALARSDVVFLIDDDSLMYPDCAEEVMRVYESDTSQRVTGVMALPVSLPPDLVAPSPSAAPTASPSIANDSWLRRLVKRVLGTRNTYFLPYDELPPRHEVPTQLRHLEVGLLDVMVGFAMTFRRGICMQERFCEALERYAAGEDQDFSYRASRHGPLVLALKARLCHLEVSGGRLSRRVTTALADLNPAALQVLYGAKPDRLARRWKRVVRRRLLIRFLKDVAERKWNFDRTRGTLLALRHLSAVYRRSPQDLLPWYGLLQKQLIESKP